MVSQPTETTIEVSEILQDMLGKAETLADGYRDPSIPEGAILGEADIEGQQVRWRKPKSMVRAGNTPLPERFEAYDKFGMVSMLPTAQMTRMLSKTRADSPGERAFHTHRNGTTVASCGICPEPKAPIEQTCEFCLERTAGAVRKRFFSETDAYAHKKRLHPDELENLERNLDRAERRAALEAQERLAEAMMNMAKSQAPEKSKKE